METPGQRHATRFPAGACEMGSTQGRTRVLAGIRAGGVDLGDLPEDGESPVVVRRS